MVILSLAVKSVPLATVEGASEKNEIEPAFHPTAIAAFPTLTPMLLAKEAVDDLLSECAITAAAEFLCLNILAYESPPPSEKDKLNPLFRLNPNAPKLVVPIPISVPLSNICELPTVVVLGVNLAT